MRDDGPLNPRFLALCKAEGKDPRITYLEAEFAITFQHYVHVKWLQWELTSDWKRRRLKTYPGCLVHTDEDQRDFNVWLETNYEWPSEEDRNWSKH